MNKNVNNVWNWAKKHKKEFAIAGVSAIGGIILYKKFSHIGMIKNWQPPKLNISNSSIDGNLVRCHDGATEVFIYEAIPLDVMGEFGKYLSRNIPDISDKSKAVYLEMAIPN